MNYLHGWASSPTLENTGFLHSSRSREGRWWTNLWVSLELAETPDEAKFIFFKVWLNKPLMEKAGLLLHCGKAKDGVREWRRSGQGRDRPHLAQADLPYTDTLSKGSNKGWKTANPPMRKCACMCVCGNSGASFFHSAWQQLMNGWWIHNSPVSSGSGGFRSGGESETSLSTEIH